jgi:hypothetical protein
VSKKRRPKTSTTLSRIAYNLALLGSSHAIDDDRENAAQMVAVSTIVPERYGTTVEIPERYGKTQKTCGMQTVKYVCRVGRLPFESAAAEENSLSGVVR